MAESKSKGLKWARHVIRVNRNYLPKKMITSKAKVRGNMDDPNYDK